MRRGPGGGSLSANHLFPKQGNTWLIVAFVLVVVGGLTVVGVFTVEPTCGESPPYVLERAQVCFRQGHTGPMNPENLAPFLGLGLDEARTLAEDNEWELVERTDDDIAREQRPDRLSVEMDDGVVVRIWPG